MTRKDFELIAAALNDVLRDPDVDDVTHANCARSLAAGLATTNARFDRERFLKACGVMS